MVRSTIAHLSGGFDSAAACILELEQGLDVQGQFIDYGQQYAAQELTAAQRLSEIFATKFPTWKGLSTRRCQLDCASTTDVDFYIPVRNLVLVAITVQSAVANNFDAISVGMRTVKRRPHDPHCFRDASIPFIALLQAAVNEACEDGVSIELRMPLIGYHGSIDKRAAIQTLLQHNIDLNILWNCFGAGSERCGVCIHCVEYNTIRRELLGEILGTI